MRVSAAGRDATRLIRPLDVFAPRRHCGFKKLDCFNQSSFTAVARLSSDRRYPESDCFARARPQFRVELALRTFRDKKRVDIRAQGRKHR